MSDEPLELRIEDRENIRGKKNVFFFFFLFPFLLRRYGRQTNLTLLFPADGNRETFHRECDILYNEWFISHSPHVYLSLSRASVPPSVSSGCHAATSMQLEGEHLQ